VQAARGNGKVAATVLDTAATVAGCGAVNSAVQVGQQGAEELVKKGKWPLKHAVTVSQQVGDSKAMEACKLDLPLVRAPPSKGRRLQAATSEVRRSCGLLGRCMGAGGPVPSRWMGACICMLSRRSGNLAGSRAAVPEGVWAGERCRSPCFCLPPSRVRCQQESPSEDAILHVSGLLPCERELAVAVLGKDRLPEVSGQYHAQLPCLLACQLMLVAAF